MRFKNIIIAIVMFFMFSTYLVFKNEIVPFLKLSVKIMSFGIIILTIIVMIFSILKYLFKNKFYKEASSIIVILLITLIGLVGYNYIPNKNKVYTKKEQKTYVNIYVKKYSKKYKVNPETALAIIHTESNFRPNVISSKEAIGLMQIQIATAKDIKEKLKESRIITKRSLCNPKTNIKYGMKYYQMLRDDYLSDYKSKDDLVLIAYNWGINNTIKNFSKTGNYTLSNIKNIVPKETYNYLKRIKKREKDYKNKI